MNKRYILKVSIAILLLLIINCMFLSIESFGIARDDIGSFENVEGSAEAENFTRNAGTIVVVTLRVITTSIAVIILIVISMKYMISAPADRADIKKHAIPYVIGVIILFGATGVLSIIQKLSTVIES